ncbi:MAG: hypothetical protein ACLRPT_10480 [Akkermansia muciniphila]
MKTPYPAARAAPRRRGNGGLHLYNPQEMQFNKPWTVFRPCPDCLRTHGGRERPSTAALPVRMEQGRELVPSPRGAR